MRTLALALLLSACGGTAQVSPADLTAQSTDAQGADDLAEVAQSQDLASHAPDLAQVVIPPTPDMAQVVPDMCTAVAEVTPCVVGEQNSPCCGGLTCGACGRPGYEYVCCR